MKRFLVITVCVLLGFIHIMAKGNDYLVNGRLDVVRLMNDAREGKITIVPDTNVNYKNSTRGETFCFKSITTTKYGELDSLISEEELSNLDSVIIYGKLNHKDLITLARSARIGKLRVLNAENAKFDGDSIPSYAFWHLGFPEDDNGNGTYTIGTPFFRRIIFPEGLTSIGYSAFYYAPLLEEFNLPSTLKRIRASAFSECRNLNMQKLVIPESIELLGSHFLFFSRGHIGEIVLPSSMKYIDEFAFAGAKADKMVFPATLEGVKRYAFQSMILKELYIEDGKYIPKPRDLRGLYWLEKIRLPSFMEEIPDSMLDGSHLTEIEFPENIKRIGVFAFPHANFTSLMFPKHLEVIDRNAFVCNLYLEDLKIMPNSVKKIGDSAFEFCPRLQRVYIPEGVEEIGSRAFHLCDSVKECILPSTLKSLGFESFANIRKLERIVSNALTPPVCIPDPNDKTILAFGVDRRAVNLELLTIPVYIPVGTKQEYMKAKGWNSFANFSESADLGPTKSTSDVEDIIESDEASDSETIYDVFGNRISSPQKGSIYIKNRKKVIF